MPPCVSWSLHQAAVLWSWTKSYSVNADWMLDSQEMICMFNCDSCGTSRVRKSSILSAQYGIPFQLLLGWDLSLHHMPWPETPPLLSVCTPSFALEWGKGTGGKANWNKACLVLPCPQGKLTSALVCNLSSWKSGLLSLLQEDFQLHALVFPCVWKAAFPNQGEQS